MKEIRSALGLLLRHRRGDVQAAEEQLGYGRSYISAVVRGRREITLGRLLLVLRALEVHDPRDWIHRATAAVRLQDLLQLGLPKRRRWAWRLLNAAGRKVWAAKPAGVPAAALGPALARLDELRHRSPAEAADGARWLALHLCPRLAAAGAREAFVRCLAV